MTAAMTEAGIRTDIGQYGPGRDGAFPDREKQSCVRVLHVLGTLNRGGAESRIMDLYRAMDRTAVQFDFLIHTDQPQVYEEEAKSLGASVYSVPRFKGTNYFSYLKALRAFFRNCPPYAFVEGHMTSTASIYLPVAKEEIRKRGYRAPVTAAHLRSSGAPSGLKGMLVRHLRKSLPEKADLLWSCAKQAAYAVYGKELTDGGRVEIIPNAVETDQFAFDAGKRRAFREAFSIPEKTVVIGHVGRFDSVKNQAFLVRVLACLKNKDVRLLYVGSGNEEAAVRELAKELSVQDRVLFAGECSREKTGEAYQAMDVFALPSFYEGLPGTVIEAEASGLPCLLSEAVTEEVCIAGREKRLPLSDPGRWADCLCGTLPEIPSDEDRKRNSETARERLSDAGYDVRILAGRMKKRYLEAQEKYS